MAEAVDPTRETVENPEILKTEGALSQSNIW